MSCLIKIFNPFEWENIKTSFTKSLLPAIIISIIIGFIPQIINKIIKINSPFNILNILIELILFFVIILISNSIIISNNCKSDENIIINTLNYSFLFILYLILRIVNNSPLKIFKLIPFIGLLLNTFILIIISFIFLLFNFSCLISNCS